MNTDDPVDGIIGMDEQSGIKSGPSKKRLNAPGNKEHHTTSDTRSADLDTESRGERATPNTSSEANLMTGNSENAEATPSNKLFKETKSMGHRKPHRSNGLPKKESPSKAESGDKSISSSASSDSGLPDATIHKKKTQTNRSKSHKISRKATEKPSKQEATDPDSDEENSTIKNKKQKKLKAKKARKLTVKEKAKSKEGKQRDELSDSDDNSSDEEPKTATVQVAVTDIKNDNTFASRAISQLSALRLGGLTSGQNTSVEDEAEEAKVNASERPLKGSKPEFVRLDRLWSKRHHRFVFSASTADKKAGEYEEYAFNILRHFDYDSKHTHTVLTILSSPLKKALVDIMGNVKGISLEEEKPSVDPNMVFLHLEELRAYMKQLKAKAKHQRNRREGNVSRVAVDHLNVLVEYLDTDYDEIKKSLYPMLESGKITFELAWGLFKSNQIMYTNTYGVDDQPRAIKIEYVTKASHMSTHQSVGD